MNKLDQRYQELGTFLRNKRARVSPIQVGLPETPNRRTPGLRREEVAQLANVGLTWYTWLEQGREIHASAQVLGNISRTLLLDEQEKAYLFLLAGQQPPNDTIPHTQPISTALQYMIDQLTLCPAIIVESHWNVLACNNAAVILGQNLCSRHLLEQNLILQLFTLKNHQKLFLNWEAIAKEILAHFRTTCAKYTNDPWFSSFIKHLEHYSPQFKALWPTCTVCNSRENHILYLPVVNNLIFQYNIFDLPAHPSLKLMVYTPDPETDTPDKLQHLFAQNKKTDLLSAQNEKV
jgi:hypothetical protein